MTAPFLADYDPDDARDDDQRWAGEAEDRWRIDAGIEQQDELAALGYYDEDYVR